MAKHEKVMDKMLDEAYLIMALIIRNHGEKYLPIFRRLHDEKELRKKNNDLAAIAFQMAEDKMS